MRYSERPRYRRLSFAQYMHHEALSQMRHELVAGEVYAMVGGTRRHATIAVNITSHLHAAARGTACQVFQESVKLRVAENTVYYPDVLVACDPTDVDELIVHRPCVVVEVTSPSSKRVDRGEKLAGYTALPSLRAYLTVDQHRKRVTAHLRGSDGAFAVIELETEGTVRIPCLDVDLTLEQIYEDVSMPHAVAEPAPMEQDFVPVEW